MTKSLPYFAWYPADAESDEFYSSLTPSELGLFHRCLNKSWVNNGLTTDLDKLAIMTGIVREEFAKLWAKVSAAWEERDGRLFNRRQEEERQKAITMSERNASAARKRYERTASAVQVQCERSTTRAYESVSESDSSSAFKEKTTLREVVKDPWPPGFDFEAWITERDRKHPIPGKPQLAIQYAIDKIFVQFTPQQFDAAHDAWCEYWKGQDGGIPSLAVFIHEAWWRKPPPIREPIRKKAGFVENVEQIFRERGRA